MKLLKKVFLHSWQRYLISFLFGIVILIAYNWIRNTWNELINYIDASFIAGFALICIGALSILNNIGTFNMFSHLFAKPNEHHVKPTYYEYNKEMALKRKDHKFNCIPYFLVGILYIFLSVILYLSA